jgi:parallel beta-helix repeat protein
MKPIRVVLLLVWLVSGLAIPCGAATFTVTSSGYSGPGTLRQALLDAQTAGGDGHRVVFAIPGPGPHVIPFWPGFGTSVGIEIDGYSQPGSRPNTSETGFNADLRIILDGFPPFLNPNNGFTISGDATIHGIAFRAFAAAILASGPRVTVTGCSFENSGIGVALQGGDGSRVGGPTPAERNWFHDLESSAILLDSAVSPIVEGNLIGTDASGFVSAPSLRGISALGGQSIVLRGNVISGSDSQGLANWGHGILFLDVGAFDPEAPTSILEGNRIGVAADGSTPLPNSADGIRLDRSDNVEIRGNVIRYNGANGIRVTGRRGISIVGNSIADNLGLGIDLEGTPGVDANDEGDLDSGPNDLQNFPVLLARNLGATGGNVRGSLRSGPSLPFEIEVFASDNCNPAGHGEGQESLGRSSVTTGADGFAEFEIPISGDHRGRYLTATATSDRGTSEFSPCLGPTGPLEVPTASTWGLLILATALVTIGLGRLRRS